MVTRQEHEERLSRYEYAPDLSVGFQYYRIGAGTTSDPEDGRDAWMIPIKITIPLWPNRTNASRQEASAKRNASQYSLKEAENISVYELKNAFYRFTSQKQIVELYANALIPEAEMAFRSDQAGYAAGREDILNLLDSEKIYLNARIAYYQAQAEALKSFALIERTVGETLTAQGGIDETR